MQVPMEQVAGLKLKTTDRHWLAVLDNVHIGMRDGHAAREIMEACFLSRWDVAHRAICDDSDTVECLQNIHMHRADEGAEAGLGTRVFNHYDPRLRQAHDVIP